MRTLHAFAVALAFVAWVPAASAQFRPPPKTDAERLTQKADEIRVEGGKALLEGDKRRAAERFQTAAGIYEEALAKDRAHAPAADGFGECATALGDHERVIRVLGPLQPSMPDNVALAYYLGVALLKTNKVAEAVPLLEKVSAANQVEHLIVHFYLGRYYLAMQRAAPAVNELQRYLAQRPEKLAANDHEIYALIGQAYLVGGDARSAKAAYTTAQSGRPEVLAYQLGIASALELENNLKDAVTLLEGLAARFPKSPEPRERVGWLLLRTGQHQKAEQAARGALQLKESAGAWHLLGAIQFAAGQYPASEASLRKSVSLDPAQPQPRLELANAIQKQGRHDQAIVLLEQAQKAGLDTVELWSTLGSVYRRSGRFQDAVKAHQRVVDLVPKKATGFVLLGADHYATGDWNKTVDAYTRAIDLEPNHAGARKWLATALLQRARAAAKLGELPDAVRDLRRGYDLQRTAPMARSLASVLLTRREFAEAEKVLAQAVTLPGAGWRERFLLGYARLGAGNGEGALAAFEEAGTLTQEPAAVADIYAGWALAKLELGDFDAAVARLSEPGKTARAGAVTEQNMPLALLKRALERLQAGDVEGADKDVETVEKLKKVSDPELALLAQFARALIRIEQGRHPDASAHLKRAFSRKESKWVASNSDALARAYLEYRDGDIKQARRYLAAGGKKASANQKEFLGQLERALDRREGELAYASGKIKPAEKSFKKALGDDPLNPFLQNNLAAALYRGKKTKDAVPMWEKVAAAIPEAQLNLGIDAQLRRRDMDEAVSRYAQYLAQGGRRSAQVKEWKERLQAIYGVAEPEVKVNQEQPASAAEGQP